MTNMSQGLVRVDQLIGGYRIVREIGRGTMGTVYEALHERIGRRAAIKLLNPTFLRNPAVSARFVNEARAVNMVQHPGLVSIYELGECEGGQMYLVMEYLDGQVLERQHCQGRLGLDGLHLFRQMASALAAIHERRIVHRDLKPANVMVIADPEAPGGQRAKILDFSIAKLRAGDSVTETQHGAVMGTPAYMAPEQFLNAGKVDETADVYSLGIMLYQMLGGQLPFIGQDWQELMTLHTFTPPRPLQEIAPSVPATLAALVHAMLAKHPAARPTMQQVAKELEQLGANREVRYHCPRTSAEDKTLLQPEERSCRRPTTRPPVAPAPAKAGGGRRIRRWLGAAAGLGLVLLLPPVIERRRDDRRPAAAQMHTRDQAPAQARPQARPQAPSPAAAPNPPPQQVTAQASAGGTTPGPDPHPPSQRARAARPGRPHAPRATTQPEPIPPQRRELWMPNFEQPGPPGP